MKNVERQKIILAHWFCKNRRRAGYCPWVIDGKSHAQPKIVLKCCFRINEQLLAGRSSSASEAGNVDTGLGPCWPSGQLVGLCGRLAFYLEFGQAGVSSPVCPGRRTSAPTAACHVHLGAISDDDPADSAFPGTGRSLHLPGR